MATGTETAAMRRAVALSSSVGEATRPNPNVGAVVLTGSGEIVGDGRHERAGGPHAEVLALRAAGGQARGGTVVVTLEPCAHTGRTGPCTEALLAAGVARVLFAVEDPTREAGGGADRLRAAGVEVKGGLLAAEAESANERWLATVRRQRPFVVWKVATTLDGRVAAADGTSRWISSPESRRDVHRLRAECDTVVAGIGTVLSDDPHLTVRDETGAVTGEQPLRVVVDTHGRTPAGARALDGAAPTWVATAEELGKGPDGRVDLDALMARAVGARADPRAARGRAHPRRGLPAGRARRPGRRLSRANLAGRRCPRPRRAPASRRWPTASRLTSPTSPASGPDLRVTARPRRQEG